MMGAFEILIRPYDTSVDIIDIVQEKVVFLFMLIIPED
jgi:hypothetical protein